MKTLKEFRESKKFLTRRQYNKAFGEQFETDWTKPEYDETIVSIATYYDGSHIELCVNDVTGECYFHLVIMRSDYKSTNLHQLEERLWDDFVKSESVQLSVEEVKEDLRERLIEKVKKVNNLDTFFECNEMFNRLIEM